MQENVCVDFVVPIGGGQLSVTLTVAVSLTFRIVTLNERQIMHLIGAQPVLEGSHITVSDVFGLSL